MAKTTTWIADVAGDASVAGNWDNGVPVDGDTVVFNSAHIGDCTFDSSLTVTITFGGTPYYTGILTIPSGVTLAVGSCNSVLAHWDISGTFSSSVSAALRRVTLRDGGSISVAATLTIYANSATSYFTREGTNTVYVGTSINLLAHTDGAFSGGTYDTPLFMPFNSTASNYTFRVPSSLVLTGALSFSHTGAGTFTIDMNTNAAVVQVSGNVTVAGTPSFSSGSSSAGQFTLTGTADQTFDLDAIAHPKVAINKPTSGNVTITGANCSLGAVNMAGALSASGTLGCTTDAKTIGGLFTAPATLTMSGAAWDFGAGANFAATTSLTSSTTTSIVFSGTGTLTGTATYINVNGQTEVSAGVTLTVAGGSGLSWGYSGGKVTIKGTVSINAGTSWLIYPLYVESTGVITGAGALYVYPVNAVYGLFQQDGTINVTTCVLYVWGADGIVVDCTIASGYLYLQPAASIAPSCTITHTGALAVYIYCGTGTDHVISGANGFTLTTPAAVNVNTSGNPVVIDGVELELTGTANQTLDMNGTVAWGDVTINKASGKVTPQDNLTAASLTVLSGGFDPNGKTITTTGDIVVYSPGKFVEDADAMNGAAIVCDNLGFIGPSAASPMLLNATAAWTIAASGAATMRNVEIEYCDASGSASEVNAPGCIDGLNNLNINFDWPALDHVPLGLGLDLAI